MRGPQPWRTQRSQALRSRLASAEEWLWVELRDRRLNGLKFVRQAPIGPYFVDFLCRKHRVVVEVDGATHSNELELEHDKRRSAYLLSSGYREYRVDNDDVYDSMDYLLDGLLIFVGTEDK
jgi:very-short-patch-repair endonuclease